MGLDREKLQPLRHLVIDMDGVLYRGREPIAGVGPFLVFLREQRIGFVLATNNSTRTPSQHVERLAQMGVAVTPKEIMTSAQATAAHLRTIAAPGTRVFMVGQDGLRGALLEAGFTLAEEDVEFVVVGMDFRICYDRLSQASILIRAGARFIATNPDRTFPSELGIVPGAGALLAFLEAATYVQPTVIGKPGTALMEQSLARMGGRPGSSAAIGDRLETDILAGQRAGMTTILVLSGITDRSMLAGSETQPDLVFQDLAELHSVWRKALAE